MADIKCDVIDEITNKVEKILCTVYLTDMFDCHKGSIKDEHYQSIENSVLSFLNEVQLDNISKLIDYLSNLEVD